MRPITLALVLMTLGVPPAAAAPQDLANEISSEIMSPYCDGVTLHDCPSQAAADLRDQIEDWARQGWTKPQIMNELENRFGSRIRATPQESEGVAAWALPLAAAVVGIAGVAVLATRWTRRSRASDELDPVDRARVEHELAALREETP